MKIPITQCYPGVVNQCDMVPRKVCQPTCSNSDMCNQCNQFVQSPSYGSCQSSPCNTYYGNDGFWNNATGGYYPGGGIGGGGVYPGDGSLYPGGEGMYPGVGGEGMYPGFPSYPDGGNRPDYGGGFNRPDYETETMLSDGSMAEEAEDLSQLAEEANTEDATN